MSKYHLGHDFERHATPARKGRGMPAEVMRRQGDPDLRCCSRDERPGPGVAEPEDLLLRPPPLFDQIPVEAFRDPNRHEGHLRMPTLGRRKAELASLHRGGGEPQSLSDAQATPGLQFQQEASAEVGRPVDQLVDGVAIQDLSRGRLRHAEGLAEERALARVRGPQPQPLDGEGEEGRELRVAETRRTAGGVRCEAVQKLVQVFGRDGLNLPLPVGLQIFLGAGRSSSPYSSGRVWLDHAGIARQLAEPS